VRLQKHSKLNLLYFVFGKKNSQKSNLKKKQSGTRKYTPENVQTIQYIYHLVKEKGMTLQGAKNQLQHKTFDAPKQVLLSKLERIKASLEQLKENL